MKSVFQNKQPGHDQSNAMHRFQLLLSVYVMRLALVVDGGSAGTPPVAWHSSGMALEWSLAGVNCE